MKPLRLLPLLLSAVSFFAMSTDARAAEPPYREAELRSVLEPSESQVRAAIRVAKQALQNRHEPPGPETIFYGTGVGQIDDWFGFTPFPQTEPPDAPSYYRFVFRGGHPVASYRNDENGERLSSFYCHDSRAFPIVSVLQDAKGKPLLIHVLTYDRLDRIKRVLALDGAYKALRMVCFVHHDGYQKTETWHYDGYQKWALRIRHLQEGGERHAITDGKREKLVAHTRLAYSQALSGLGLAPLYPGALPKDPLPADQIPKLRPAKRAPAGPARPSPAGGSSPAAAPSDL